MVGWEARLFRQIGLPTGCFRCVTRAMPAGHAGAASVFDLVLDHCEERCWSDMRCGLHEAAEVIVGAGAQSGVSRHLSHRN